MKAGHRCMVIAGLLSPPAMALAASLPQVPYALAVEAAHGDVRFREQALEIAADKGTDLFTDPVGKEASDNAPRVLFAPEGDFIFSAKVSPRFGGPPYEGGALLVHAGPACWGKLLFERFKSGHNGVATTTSRGAGGDDAYHGTRDGSHQYLKIVRYGSTYIFYTSQDGSGWNFVRSFALPCDGPVRIGLMAQAPRSEDFVADFADVQFRADTIRDYWQGE